MNTTTLDDTLFTVVQATHEHGLPLHGVHALAGTALVFCDVTDVVWWAQWLADAAPEIGPARFTVWRTDDDVALHLSGERSGIDWAVAVRLSADVADSVFSAHGLAVTSEHTQISPAVVYALLAAEVHNLADVTAVAA